MALKRCPDHSGQTLSSNGRGSAVGSWARWCVPINPHWYTRASRLSPCQHTKWVRTQLHRHLRSVHERPVAASCLGGRRIIVSPLFCEGQFIGEYSLTFFCPSESSEQTWEGLRWLFAGPSRRGHFDIFDLAEGTRSDHPSQVCLESQGRLSVRTSLASCHGSKSTVSPPGGGGDKSRNVVYR